MPADLSMNQIIHAAVRRDLARTEAALRDLSDGEIERARGIRRAWDFMVAELKHHHEGEDKHLWPFLRDRGVDGDLLDAMAAEHEDLHEALVTASEAIDAVVAEPTAVRATAAAEVVVASTEVIAAHLDHEEREIEDHVREHQEHPEFKAMEKQVRHANLVKAGNFLAWVQEGASAHEVAALKATIPAPVVVLVTALLGRGYRARVAPVWGT